METTLPLFRKLVADPDFLAGAVDTQWLERRLSEGLLEADPPSAEDLLLAAVSLSDAPRDRAAGKLEPPSRWRAAARAEARRS